MVLLHEATTAFSAGKPPDVGMHIHMFSQLTRILEGARAHAASVAGNTWNAVPHPTKPISFRIHPGGVISTVKLFQVEVQTREGNVPGREDFPLVSTDEPPLPETMAATLLIEDTTRWPWFPAPARLLEAFR